MPGELCTQFNFKLHVVSAAASPGVDLFPAIKPSNQRWNLGEVKIEDLASLNYNKLRDKCVKNRLPPLSPNAFEHKLRTEESVH